MPLGFRVAGKNEKVGMPPPRLFQASDTVDCTADTPLTCVGLKMLLAAFTTAVHKWVHPVVTVTYP